MTKPAITQSELREKAKKQLKSQQQDRNDAAGEWASIMSNACPEETLEAIEESLREEYEVIEG